ncbi:MAG TPA: ChbG/HpnK family deacetylase [Acidobacteriota bacterium]|nr:ChbG/HpnK family deacetylase [Acidobacteriota bacterium]
MKLLLSIFLLLAFSYSHADSNAPQVLLRLDDNGMNHAVVAAIRQVAETGIPFSASVMFTCPWYQEAVDVLKQFPNVSAGVHLVLNSEWKYYRWGPVLGKTAVPSLVDQDGFFLYSTEAFLASPYKLDEVEKELSAQIDRGKKSGLKLDYVDYHMWTAISTPQLRAIVEKLAKQNQLGISRYFGEEYQSMFDVPVEKKSEEFFKRLNGLQKNVVNLVVMHVAQDTPEMQALIDMNNPDQRSGTEPIVARHRSAELKILLSKQFQDLLKSGAIKLLTYRDVVNSQGLDSMKRPADD